MPLIIALKKLRALAARLLWDNLPSNVQLSNQHFLMILLCNKFSLYFCVHSAVVYLVLSFYKNYRKEIMHLLLSD